MTPHDTLKKYFGFESFREGQLEIINSILDGSNVLCVLPTGGGKSLCYQIPALLGKNFSIVVSPLIALMKDQVDNVNKNYKVAAYINSSLNIREISEVFNKVNSKLIKLLFVSPEKLEQNEFVQKIKNLCPDYIFVDEAHCISEWGHNFRPSYRNIVSFAEQIGIETISAFTATASPEVQDDIISLLGFQNPKKIIKGFERNNLSIKVLSEPGKKELVSELLKQDGSPAIIYCATRKMCEEVAMFLKYKSIKAEHYHAGLTSELRKIIQDDFIADRLEVIVATNAFGMGIDKPNIRNVIHYNLPGSIENYYQEIGRAGRDGNEASASLLFTKNDVRIQKFLIESSYPTETEIRMIYNIICNSIRLAVGSQPSSPVNLTEELIIQLKTMNITPIKLDSAFKTLEQSGYLKKITSSNNDFYIQFRINQQTLRKYIKTEQNKSLSDLLILIIREIGLDSFSKHTRFNPNKIADQLNLSVEKITEYLNQLAGYGYIEFSSPSNYGTISFLSPRIDADRLYIDYDLLKSRMENELFKLKKMHSFISSDNCRFSFILNYFGEVSKDYKCGKCDLCNAKYTTSASYNNFLNEKVLETLQGINSPIKKKGLIKLLQGTSRHQGLVKNKFYGTLQHFTKNEIEKGIEILLNEGKIDIHLDTLILSEEYKGIVNNSNDNHNLSENAAYDDYLKIYNTLKTLRKEIAYKFNQTEEILCSNNMLNEIAKQLPDSPSKLMSIKGMTQRHFNKFGDEFIEAIIIYNKENTIQKKVIDNLPDSSLKIVELLRNHYSLDDIVSLTKLPEAVVSMQIESILELDKTIEINSLIDAEEISLIRKQMVNGVQNIKTIKKLIPSNISYGKIRIVLAKYKSANF
jgi:ATP-dependent DNA helicase RecQ